MVDLLPRISIFKCNLINSEIYHGAKHTNDKIHKDALK